jgi:hypothetical protein
MKEKLLIWSLCLVVVFTSCIKKETERILVEVFPKEINIDGKKITHEEFEIELKKAINVRLEAGIKQEVLFVSLIVDADTKRGQIADIEVAMRKLNVRKVLYSTRDGKTNAG